MFVSELSDHRLEDEITELAAHINAGTCRWLELVAEFDRREGWANTGCRSTAEWLAWRCALASRSAREHVRVARALVELPQIKQRFSRGALSYTKVRALTRIARPDTEQRLIMLARHATAAQLERIVRGLRRVSNQEADEAHEERYFSAWWEPDGSLELRGRLSPEDGALFLKALDRAHDALRERPQESSRNSGDTREGGSAEPRPPQSPGDFFVKPPSAAVHSFPSESAPLVRQTHADALAAMAAATLAGGLDGADARPGGDRYQVVVRVDAGDLRGQSDRRGDPPRLEEGSALAVETARRIACDASIVPVIEVEGSTLSVGRKTRAVPPALGRALALRDRTCRFPGCENRRFLQRHHIRHWAKGGETSAHNLVRLCARHHRLVHEGGCSVERLDDGTLRFRGPDGASIPEVPAPPPGDPGRVRAGNRAAGLPIDERTCLSGSGEKLELGYAVAVLSPLVTEPEPEPDPAPAGPG